LLHPRLLLGDIIEQVFCQLEVSGLLAELLLHLLAVLEVEDPGGETHQGDEDR